MNLGPMAALAGMGAALGGLALCMHWAVGRRPVALVAASALLSGVATQWAPTVSVGGWAVPALTATVVPTAFALVVVAYVAHGSNEARYVIWAWVLTQLVHLGTSEVFSALASAYAVRGPELPGLDPTNSTALRPVVPLAPSVGLRVASAVAFCVAGHLVAVLVQLAARMRLPFAVGAALALVGAALVDGFVFPVLLHPSLSAAGAWMPSHLGGIGATALGLSLVTGAYLSITVHPGVGRALRRRPLASIVRRTRRVDRSQGSAPAAAIVARVDGSVVGASSGLLNLLELERAEAPRTWRELRATEGPPDASALGTELSAPMTLRSRTGTAAVDAVRADVRVDGKGYDALVFEGRGRGRSTQGRTAGADATIAALQTASSLGHDVANLVQTLVLLAAMPAERMPREWFTDTTGRLAQLANRLKELGRPPTVTREPLALAALVQSIVAPYGGVLPGGATLVVHPIDEDLRALGDGVDLDRCILNLLLNASQATGAAGHVHLRVALEADGVVIEIRDDGPGIEDVAAVMEPYASNRPGGTGLGLPSVATAMQRMGGTLSIESQVGSGTVVRLRLTPAR